MGNIKMDPGPVAIGRIAALNANVYAKTYVLERINNEEPINVCGFIRINAVYRNTIGCSAETNKGKRCTDCPISRQNNYSGNYAILDYIDFKHNIEDIVKY